MAYTSVSSRLAPSSLYTGTPAALPAMSQRATSTGAQAFMFNPRRPLRIGRQIPKTLALERVASEYLGLEDVENGAELPVSAAPEVSDEAVALDALVGLDAQHTLLDVAEEAAQVGVESCVGQCASDDFYLDVGYLQFSSSSFTWDLYI